MISYIMTKSTSPHLIKEVEHSIKIFLSMTHRFEILQDNDSSRKYHWVSKSNYLSLLNLPRQMELYGPLRLYWEGGYCGEGIIQDIKGILNHGLSLGWQKNTLKKLYINRSLTFLVDENNSNIDTTKNFNDIDRNYKRYGRTESIVEKFQNHLPLSMIFSKKGVYYIAIDKKLSIQIIKKKYTHNHGGMDFFSWELADNDMLSTPSREDIKSYCLLLPKVDNDQIDILIQQNQRIYGSINSDWQELVRHKGFTTPFNISTDDIMSN